MHQDRTPRVWSLWCAALAALCLLAFGSVPGSGKTAVAHAVSGVATSSTPAAKAITHPDAPPVTRTADPASHGWHLNLPSVDLTVAGTVFALAALFLIGRRRGEQLARPVRGPSPARAPPVAA